MSFWGAQVIMNLFSTIPVIGEELSVWIRGDYNVVSDATLNRFFSLHVIAIPLALLGLMAAHLIALHEDGLQQPGRHRDPGREPRCRRPARPLDGIPFHPYYTVKDILGVSVFLIVFCGRGVLRARGRGLLPGVQQLHSGRPAHHARRTSRPCGTSRPSTRCCVPRPTTS
jgi:ubiquinol-cytochrome c reductase cytochrome b subunit